MPNFFAKEHFFAKGTVSTDSVSEDDFHIHNCGLFRGVRKDIVTLRPFGRGDYQLIFNGAGRVRMPGGDLREGECYLFLPGEKQEYAYEKGEKTAYYWLHFSGGKVAGTLRELELCGGKSDAGEHKGELEALFGMMLAGYRQNRKNADRFAEGLTHAALALIAGDPRRTAPFAKAFDLLCDMTKETSVGEIAALYQMTEENFIRRFRQYTGIPPRAYRMEKQMEQAKNLLSATHLKVAEIAESLAFSDTQYFCRIFKKKTGLSPTAYRKKYL